MESYLDQWANVLVLHRTLSFELVEAAAVGTVSHGLILEIALASLVANGAVQRVVGEQELHDALTRLVDERRVGLDDHAGLYRPCARGDWLRSPLHFDQAHTATSSNHQLLVVAVSRDGNSGLVAGLDEGRAGCWGALEPCGQSGGVYSGFVPSIDTFSPSDTGVSIPRRPQWGVAQTDSELNVCWAAGRGTQGPAAIEGCAEGRPPQRPDHLLPQHCEALKDGDGLVAAELQLTFTMASLRLGD